MRCVVELHVLESEAKRVADHRAGRRPFLWAKCHRCNAEPKIDLRELVRPPERPYLTSNPRCFVSSAVGQGATVPAPTSSA